MDLSQRQLSVQCRICADINMTQDELKQAVAQAALDFIAPHMSSSSILGVGTGSTANFFIDLLATSGLPLAGTVSSSQASAQRLQAHSIPVFELNDIDQMDFYVDGADETTPNLELIKGGGAALTREKIVAAVADTFVCIADKSKWVAQLGAFPLPVEVIPMARRHVTKQLQKLGGTPIYREGIITDNGGEILDVHDLQIIDPCALEAQINQITGVITNGLFAQRPADVLLLGTETGIKTYHRNG